MTNRLQAIADLVDNGSTIVDVGTDHGYIPAYLMKNEIAAYAVACDINESPLNSCRMFVESLNLEDRIECVLSDGLKNIQSDFDSVIIAGMGGELISSILDESKDRIKNCKLIINPMTHPEHARKWLYQNGYIIEKDFIVRDSNHYYSIFTARYVGIPSTKSEKDYFLGEITDFSCKEYFEHLLVYLRNKQKSGVDYSGIINFIEEKI